MDALPLQLMVIVQPLGIDDGNVAFAVLGDELFSARLYLIGKIGKCMRANCKTSYLLCRDLR
jgi:hypothetical protein